MSNVKRLLCLEISGRWHDDIRLLQLHPGEEHLLRFLAARTRILWQPGAR